MHRPSAPQGNQCLLSHFLATAVVWEPKRKLIAHQCCDQLTAAKTGYPLTSIIWPYRRLKCRPIELEYFLKLSADKLPVSNERGLKFIFSNYSYQYVVFMSLWPLTIRILILTSDAKIQPVFLKIQAGKPFLTMVTLYLQFLCSDWSKFDRWVHALPLHNKL